jgi:hypothetical protein
MAKMDELAGSVRTATNDYVKAWKDLRRDESGGQRPELHSRLTSARKDLLRAVSALVDAAVSSPPMDSPEDEHSAV